MGDWCRGTLIAVPVFLQCFTVDWTGELRVEITGDYVELLNQCFRCVSVLFHVAELGSCVFSYPVCVVSQSPECVQTLCLECQLRALMEF